MAFPVSHLIPLSSGNCSHAFLNSGPAARCMARIFKLCEIFNYMNYLLSTYLHLHRLLQAMLVLL